MSAHNYIFLVPADKYVCEAGTVMVHGNSNIVCECDSNKEIKCRTTDKDELALFTRRISSYRQNCMQFKHKDTHGEIYKDGDSYLCKIADVFYTNAHCKKLYDDLLQDMEK